MDILFGAVNTCCFCFAHQNSKHVPGSILEVTSNQVLVSAALYLQFFYSYSLSNDSDCNCRMGLNH